MPQTTSNKHNLEEMELQVERFNELYPVGSPVDLLLDSGKLKRTKVRHPAYVLSGHTPVAFFEGVAGCYWIEMVRPIPVEEVIA